MSDRVLVTGASSFIGSHVVLNLLQKGYLVRGTLRDLSKKNEVIETTSENYNGDINDRLEFVKANLLEDDGWSKAAIGCDYIIHLASPFPLAEPTDENDVIIPAKDGTLRILRAAQKAKIKKFILTSSNAAIFYGHKDYTKVYDENDWTDISKPIGAYLKSKTIAEKAAWDFVDNLNENEQFEFCTINPNVVLGPLLSKRVSTSTEIIRILLNRQYPALPKVGFLPVDVRDVASLHVEALTNPEVNRRRLICASTNIWLVDIAKILRSSGYNVTTKQMPNFLLKLLSIFDPTLKLIVKEFDIERKIDTSETQRIFNWTTKTHEEMILSTAKSLVDRDLVSIK